jgi:hypothetical protein
MRNRLHNYFDENRHFLILWKRSLKYYVKFCEKILKT